MSKMTVRLTDLLDLAISPQIGPVNFFHLRNLLYSLLEHFDIGEVKALRAAAKRPASYSNSEISSSSQSDSEYEEIEREGSERDSESGNENEEVEEKIEQEVTKTVIDDDGKEKTITVTETIIVSVPNAKPKAKEERKGDGQKKKHEDKSEKKENKKGEEEKSEKKDNKNEKEREKKDKSAYGTYGKEDKKKEAKVTLEALGDSPQVINLTRRIEAAEAGIRSLRNIIDSMVNQVDFGGDVGNLLKEQLTQVQNQLNSAQLASETEPESDEKRKEDFKTKEEAPDAGIITEGAPPTNVLSTQMPALAPSTVPVIPALIPAVISPKSSHPESHIGSKEAGVPVKGLDTRPPSQEVKPPLRKRTTMQDLKLRKMARAEGLSVEEVEARETRKEADIQKENDKSQKENAKDKKDSEKKIKEKKNENAESTSDEESVDSEEEREAMEEMIREEIEAALENPEASKAQAYALRLGLEQMANVKKSVQATQEEIRKEMDKTKRAIDQITKELIAFRAARKAQDAEGFNAVHHVHSMVLELQAKHEKIVSTISELVNEYNRREKTIEELFGHVDRLDQNKADKCNVSKEINVKADKLDLESKVSVIQFDETFNLLDQGLSEALEKMDNQMSLEQALKETLSELQYKLNMKLDRDDLDSLRQQLESRLREVQMCRVIVKEVKDEGEPAGFRRNPEKVNCISCNRSLEVQVGSVNTNVPKMQSLPAQKSNKPYTTYELDNIRQYQKFHGSRKAVIGADLGYQPQKLKNDVMAMTGMVDLADLSPSHRFCGGSHTIMHPFRRSFKSTSTHFNQYVMIREDEQTNPCLPRRDFIVPKSESQYKKYSNNKPLPAIGQPVTRNTSPSLDYDTFRARPQSAPSTPSLGSNPPIAMARSSPSSPPCKEKKQRNSAPLDVEKLNVTVPSLEVENDSR